jgi:hypothetical protein
VCTFRKAIKNVKVKAKVDVQKGVLVLHNTEINNKCISFIKFMFLFIVVISW